MEREDWFWLAFWVGFAALDLYADSRGKSLCASVRRVFGTETPDGRDRLGFTFDAGAWVLRRHLLK